MTSSRIHLIAGAIALALTTCAGHGGCRAAPARAAERPPIMRRTLTIDEAARRLWRPGARFEPSTAAERDGIATLVAGLTRAAADAQPDPEPWLELARAIDLRVEEWRVAGERYWALVELETWRRGAGAYLFRVAPRAGRAILLQAPHAFHDVGTGPIGAALFFEPSTGPRPSAFFTNTVHRYGEDGALRGAPGGSPADVCHNPDHVFTGATVAFATAAGGAAVIQLHGFARDDDAGASIVVSAGDVSGSSRASAAVAAALARQFDGVRRFPEDIGRLGATTNAQRRALRRIVDAELIHIEADPDVRAALRADPVRRRTFARAVFEAVLR